ncbi:hypothetical protein PIB30_101537, partial [Stylosanthes scabra]|nr:hypothetical protein [Stylosanthes scabra]
QIEVQAEASFQKHKPTKLFIFGDSYVDTGNTIKNNSFSWKEPYGITFPGKPAGRFSDGKVFTDFIAKYLGLKSPVPYNLREMMANNNLEYGINFAVGGTGVFDTEIKPNMTTQIDFFEEIIKDKVYNASDLTNSLAYVSVAGNDYNYYLATHTNDSISGILPFILLVVNQTANNLIRIHKLGVKKIAVGMLQPIGCLPLITSQSSFQKCNDTINILVDLHNALLTQTITKLNQEGHNGDSTFLTLNLFDSFNSVLGHHKTYNKNNNKALIPCCVGISQEYVCGSVENNVKKYNVCENPKKAFFWDLFHPTQAGWHAVYKNLQSMGDLRQLRF